MIVGVDIGATKTLVGIFHDSPDVVSQTKFATPKDFETFVAKLIKSIATYSRNQAPKVICVAARGEVDSKRGELSDHKLLKWDRVPLGQSLESAFKDSEVILCSDAGAATLGEAHFGAGEGYSRVLYVTISTGIGTGMTIDGRIVLDNSGGGDMVVGQYELDDTAGQNRLENRLSGTAFINRFDHPPYEVTDSAVWSTFANELALGLNNLIVPLHPDIVILGGGVANHFDKFIATLQTTLDQYNTYQYSLPPIVQAKYVDTAVLIGAYAKAKGLGDGAD